MIATEGRNISVTLEKQIQPTDTADDALTRAYLDNICLNRNTGRWYPAIESPIARR